MDWELIIQKWYTLTLSQVILAIQAINTELAVKKWLLPMLLLRMVVPITNRNMSVGLSLAMELLKILIRKEPAR